MAQKWVAIHGDIRVEENSLVFSPPPPGVDGQQHEASLPIAVARSNIKFEQGSIRLQAKLSSPEDKVQIGLTTAQGEDLFIGLNSLGVSFGAGIFRNTKWDGLGGTGSGTVLPVNRWLDLEVRLTGSEFELFFEDVKVFSLSQTIRQSTIGLFLQTSHSIEIRNIEVTTKAAVCFVVMQFTEDYNTLYNDVIKPTCEKFGYKVVRADDFYNSSPILDDITRSIKEATIIIADITPDNPNVYYEVGYAHALSKQTILLSDNKREKLPFDVSGFRTLFYQNSIGGKRTVEERLQKHLEAIIQ